jgi:hypothetical protein
MQVQTIRAHKPLLRPAFQVSSLASSISSISSLPDHQHVRYGKAARVRVYEMERLCLCLNHVSECESLNVWLLWQVNALPV